VITPTGTTLELACNPSENDIDTALGTATASDNCSIVTPTPSDGPVGVDGCMRSQTRTWTVTDACGNDATALRTVTWTFDVTDPGFSSLPASMDLDCDAVIPEMPTLTGTDNCPGNVTVTPGEVDVAADCATGFSRIITRTWMATDACGNTATHEQVIRIRCCPVLCTYTQGYFGNKGGKACNGDDDLPNRFSTFETIQNSINTQAGSITIGTTGNSVVVTSSATDVNTVIEVLPGGGKASAFTHNSDASITALPGSYLKKGKINNTLFAQTLTLSINMGIKEGLGDFALEAGKYLVTAETQECGSTDAKECEFEWNGVSWVLTYSPYEAFDPIPQALYDALATKDVSGLLALANDALGGGALPAGVSLGMIASAVDMINNAFDECRLYIGWNESSDMNALCEAPVAPPVVQQNSKSIINNDLSVKQERLEVKAFPNPVATDGVFNLRIRSAESGTAVIEYFNVNGAQLGQINRIVQANSTETVRINASLASGPILYKVSINGKYARGVVLRMN
jgi:hypothetical protein